MSDMKDKLRALASQDGLMMGAEWRQKLQRLERQRAEGRFEIDKIVPGEVLGGTGSGFYLVREDFPLDTRHGAVTLGAALEAAPEHIALSACDDELEAFEPGSALFIDAETTGLAGGTGTVAFLIGVGYFVGDAFRLEQCFMRDFDDEEPMLEYLNSLFQGRDAVVSYNGKSFDLPLLRTRFIQNRIPFRLDSAMHFDLVHAARRFWRRRLQDCTLGNVERAILGLKRHGDVPSSEIPQMYFDYLRTRDARPLAGVFYHHKTDILSLVALAAWLARCLSVPDGEGFEHSQDKLCLVRVHFMRKEYEAVVRHGQRLLEAEAESEVRRECLEFLGFAHKRLHGWQEMEDTWALLLQESPMNLVARLELAKHHEHRTRNLIEAERICAEVVQFLETRAALGRAEPGDAALDMFASRLARIRQKLAKGRGDA
ncbi:MAG: ribonuclease H-like domain-containing protein [Candidatus Hydrogenedentes bacterium]|nr:ribonuclease H-like domain-containing protein [Candidatus Hydrogenedentota bacterium]